MPQSALRLDFRWIPEFDILAKRLIDCHIEFLSESRLGLGGLSVRVAYEDRQQRVERSGWLCEFDIPERELTKAAERFSFSSRIKSLLFEVFWR